MPTVKHSGGVMVIWACLNSLIHWVYRECFCAQKNQNWIMQQGNDPNTVTHIQKNNRKKETTQEVAMA